MLLLSFLWTTDSLCKLFSRSLKEQNKAVPRHVDSPRVHKPKTLDDHVLIACMFPHLHLVVPIKKIYFLHDYLHFFNLFLFFLIDP